MQGQTPTGCCEMPDFRLDANRRIGHLLYPRPLCDYVGSRHRQPRSNETCLACLSYGDHRKVKLNRTSGCRKCMHSRTRIQRIQVRDTFRASIPLSLNRPAATSDGSRLNTSNTFNSIAWVLDQLASSEGCIQPKTLDSTG